MNGWPEDRSEVGRDLLDEALGTARHLRVTDVFGRTRAALGLKPLTAPALLFVPLGAALGPAGTGWLGPVALTPLYAVTAMALAALGIFVGFGLRFEHGYDRRLLGVASLEALITVSVVAIGSGLLLSAWQVQLDASLAFIAIVLGLCASATSAGEVTADDPPTHHAAMRIADLDDALPIVAGAAVMAFGAAGLSRYGLALTALNVLLPLGVALAGWLLVERTTDPGERAVFVVGLVALLGGGAAYLGVSPLLAGMVAGLFWTHAPGRTDAMVAEDLRRLQHPLVVLLLIVAGASARPTLLGLWMAGVYVITRLNGKMLGGWVVWRAAPGLSPADLGSFLLAPGVIGLAFALAVHIENPTTASTAVVTAVAIGTLASELLAALMFLGPVLPPKAPATRPGDVS